MNRARTLPGLPNLRDERLDGAYDGLLVAFGEILDRLSLAKKDKKTGMTSWDMQAYKDLNKELPDPFLERKVRGPERHPGRGHGSQRHGYVGPVNHIPIRD